MNNSSPISVLLVDDNRETQDIVRLIMDHHGCPLTIASNAEAALEQLQTNIPDAILLDILLPDMNGYETLHAIRNAHLPHMPKVIAITGNYTDETPTVMKMRGFDGYLPKPLVPTEVVPYLRALIASKS